MCMHFDVSLCGLLFLEIIQSLLHNSDKKYSHSSEIHQPFFQSGILYIASTTGFCSRGTTTIATTTIRSNCCGRRG